MILRVVFHLPTIILNWLSLLLPFNKSTYNPSTETDRELSQYMRNKIRLANYRTKCVLFGNTKELGE